jgi:hypothetical protein
MVNGELTPLFDPRVYSRAGGQLLALQPRTNEIPFRCFDRFSTGKGQ